MPSEGNRWRVAEGDTLWSIAEQAIGDPERWMELVDANPRAAQTRLGTIYLTPGALLWLPLAWVLAAQAGSGGSFSTEPAKPAGCGCQGASDAAGFADASGSSSLPFNCDTRKDPCWSRDDLATVVEMGRVLGVSAEGMLGTWMGESGLDPQMVGYLNGRPFGFGLAQITSGGERAAGLTPGSASLLVSVPLRAQLQAIFQLYRANLAQLGARTFAAAASTRGITPEGMLYAMAFLPARAAPARSSTSILTRRGESYYTANQGLDLGNKGYITLGDMDARAQKFRSNALATYPAFRSELVAIRSEGGVPSLASLFSSIGRVWSSLSLQPVATEPHKLSKPAPRHDNSVRDVSIGTIALVGLGAALAFGWYKKVL